MRRGRRRREGGVRTCGHDKNMELEGKVCLITGGSSGIGAATAREFAFRGADIAVCGLPADDLLAQAVKQDMEALNRRAFTITADVADPNEAVRCVEQTVATLGHLDVLVHCAGGPAPGGLLECGHLHLVPGFRYSRSCGVPSRQGGGSLHG